MTIAFLALVAVALVTMFAVDPAPKPIDTSNKDKSVELLTERMVAIRAQCDQFLETAQTDKRNLTEEERGQIRELNVEFEQLKDELQLREALDKQNDFLNASAGPKVPLDQPRQHTEFEDTRGADPVQPTAHRTSVPAQPRSLAAGRCGYRSFGEFADTVRNAARPGGHVDKRLYEMRAPTTVGSEGSGPDGGFAIPPDFRNEILIKVMGEDTLLGRTTQIQTEGNTLTLPLDETTPWQTSGGILANWEGENNQLTQSKPQLNQVTVRANKLAVLVPITDELLEDATALDSYLRRKAPEKINFKVNLAIMQGTGAGQPLGILNAPGTVSVAKEGSQTADTVVYENVRKMYNAMYAPYRNSGAVWLINQDVEPQLQQMVHAGTSSDVPVWLPAGGISGKPFDTLYGHPIITTQACETLGDLGDIVFASMPEYLSVIKAGGIRAETSMHLWFDYDTMAFRFIMRVGGLPMLSSAISARDGSGSYGAFVSLAVRG